MTDAGYTISGDALSRLKPVPDGSGAHLAEQVSMEADRLSGAVKDGVEAVEVASKTYGSLFLDSYARMIRVSMQHNIDVGNHLLALMKVRTPADALRINLEFAQDQIASAQGRLHDMLGLRSSLTDKGGGAQGRV